jgi:predicted nucleic acid-binding protein
VSKAFVDTNILVYTLDKRNPAKRTRCLAAESARCEFLFSEDLNSGQIIRNVRIVDPLK